MDIPEEGVLKTSQRYFFTPSALASELFYYPTRAGHYFCDHRYSFSHRAETALLASHRLNFMLIAVRQGAMHFTLNGEHLLAARGSAVLFDCRQPHEYSAGDGTEFNWLLFNGLNAGAFCKRILQSKGGRSVFTPADFTAVVREIDSLVASCAAGERLTESVCSQLIHRLLCGLLPGGEGASKCEDGVVTEAIRYMHRNLHQELTVQDVAEAVRLSPSHFSRLFRSQTGYSPYEYILLRRIDEAKHLLASTRLSVKEIAYRIGYNSEENFIHSFQKKVGVSPGTFREYPI